MKCPKCQKTFVVGASAGGDPWDSDPDPEQESEDTAETRRGSRNRPAPRAGRSDSRTNPLLLAGIGGGILIVLGAFAGVYLSGMLSRAPEPPATRPLAGTDRPQPATVPAGLPARSTTPAPSSPELPAEKPGKPLQVRIKAAIDGRDELRLFPQYAHWTHLEWSVPTEVEINGVKWNPNAGDRLNNEGATAFLPEGFVVEKPEVTIHRGRGPVHVVTASNGICVIFNDGEFGADWYELTLTFPNQTVPAPIETKSPVVAAATSTPPDPPATATPAEELPYGMRRASLAPGAPSETTFSGGLEESLSEGRLTLYLELAGDLGLKAVDFGKLKILKAVDDKGRPLAYHDEDDSWKSYVKSMVPTNRSQRGVSRKPIEYRLRFDKNPQMKSIQELTASVQFRTPKSTRPFVIPDVPSLVDRQIADPKIKDFVQSVSLFSGGGLKTVDITVHEPAMLLDTHTTGLSGKDEGADASGLRLPGGLQYSVLLQEPGEKPFSLEGEVCTEFVEHSVTFTFTDLALEGDAATAEPAVASTTPTSDSPKPDEGTASPEGPTPPEGATLAKNKDNLPKGAILWARTGDCTLQEPNGTTPFVLSIGIQGDRLGESVEVGKLTVKTLAGPDGKPLRHFFQMGGSNDFSKGFSVVEHDTTEGFIGQPEGGSQALLFVSQPPPGVKTIGKLSGSYMVKVPKKTREFSLEKIKSLIGKPSTDPELKAVGFTMKSVKSSSGIDLVLKVRPPAVLSKLEVTGTPADKFEFHLALRNKDERGDVSYSIHFQDSITPQHGLKFKLSTDPEILTVPFEFENVPLTRGQGN